MHKGGGERELRNRTPQDKFQKTFNKNATKPKNREPPLEFSQHPSPQFLEIHPAPWISKPYMGMQKV